jgi:hypothetical protein
VKSLAPVALGSIGRPGKRREVPVVALPFQLKVGVVTLSETSLISTIEQQAKSLKSHTSTLTSIGEFRSI